MTEGGPPPAPCTEYPILKLVNEKAPNADAKLPCVCDTTAACEYEDSNSDEDDSNYKVEYLDEYRKYALETTNSPYALSKSHKKHVTRDKEKLLRIQKLEEGIEQQRSLHKKRMKIAEMEAQIVEVKLKQAMIEFEMKTGDKFIYK